MTFVQNGRPAPDSKEEILSFLIAGAEAAFGQEFTPDQISIVRSFYEPVATYCASQQGDLSDVLNSTQIDHAEGEALDLLGALIGVSRRDAAPATTRLQFQHDAPVSTTYPIPAGTTAQTDSAESVRFETEEYTELKYIDGFEDGNIDEYSGDTAVFTTQSTTTHTGTLALEASASTGAIANIDTTVPQGSRLHAQVYPETNTIPAFLFGVDTLDDHYKVALDTANNECRLSVVEGGTETGLGSISTTIPSGLWLHVQIDWNHDGNYSVLIEDAAGSEIVSFSASESVPTFTGGGVGFESEDSTATKYFDEVTMSRVSVGGVATEPGSETNVGSDTVTVLSGTIPGVDEVTNPIAASNGTDREGDDEFRSRAKDEPGTTLRATLQALIDRLDSMNVTRTVTVIDNDENTQDAAGRPPHSFEAIVDTNSDNYTDVAEMIVNTKAVGDTSVGGYAGDSVTRTVRLSNGQDKDITFSTPTVVTVYVDISLVKTGTYAGDDQVRDSIAQYIGGTLSSENNVDGEIGAGDNVVYYQVLEAIMDVEGVHDVSNLDIGTSANPTGVSNITIQDNETANIDATDDSISVTTSDL